MGRANETVLVRPWVCRRGPVSVGRAFGTLSELLQGALPEDGPEFLVTFPIGAWREATLCLCEAHDRRLCEAHDRRTVSPPRKTKALVVVRRVMAAAAPDPQLQVHWGNNDD